MIQHDVKRRMFAYVDFRSVMHIMVFSWNGLPYHGIGGKLCIDLTTQLRLPAILYLSCYLAADWRLKCWVDSVAEDFRETTWL